MKSCETRDTDRYSVIGLSEFISLPRLYVMNSIDKTHLDTRSNHLIILRNRFIRAIELRHYAMLIDNATEEFPLRK